MGENANEEKIVFVVGIAHILNNVLKNGQTIHTVKKRIQINGAHEY